MIFGYFCARLDNSIQSINTLFTKNDDTVTDEHLECALVKAIKNVSCLKQNHYFKRGLYKIVERIEAVLSNSALYPLHIAHSLYSVIFTRIHSEKKTIVTWPCVELLIY